MTQPGNRTTRYTYDLAGNMLSVTDPMGNTWTYGYDDNNRQNVVTDPLGNSRSVRYDAAGNVIAGTDENDITTEFSYNALNQLVSVKDALGNITEYEYDSNGNLVSATDAMGHTAILAYDGLNRLIEETNPLGETYTRAYDPVGNLVAWTRPDETSVIYEYGSNNRLSAIKYPDESQVTYGYDGAGNRTSMNDPQGTTSYSYDDLNRLQTVTGDGNSATYDYDSAGNITSLTYPGGSEVEYTYDGRNLMTSVFDGLHSTTLSYDDAGKRINELLANGILVNYLYDACGRLTVVEHVYGEDTIAKSEYTLDNVGNRLSMTDAQGRTTQYTYDDLYQLIDVDYSDGQEVGYTYDAVGNRLTAGNTSYTYDAANRITSMDGTAYSYDRNGNLIEAGNEEYDYDFENRLVSYTNGTDTIEYIYDGNGERIVQTVTGSVYEQYSYFNDTSTGISRVLAELDSGENYIYGGRLLYRIDPEELIFYHQDGLGSISVVSDVYGEPLNIYEYDVFGDLRSSSETVSNLVLFTGEFQDPNGLIYLRARYYDPTDGRFLTSDTVFGDLTDPLSQNRYVYCSNNPVIYVDPSGHLLVCLASNSDTSQNIGVFPTPPLDEETQNLILNPIQNALDVGGIFIDPADLVNGIISGARGDVESAALSGAAFIPFFGAGVKFIDKADDVGDAAKTVKKVIPSNPKKVGVDYLKKKGVDPHELKYDTLGDRADISKYNIYVDKKGGLWLQKNGSKEFIPTYQSIGK